MTDAYSTLAGIERIRLFDRLEAMENQRPVTDEGMRAKQLKRDLVASAFGAKETAAAVAFLTKLEAEWAASGNRPPALPDLQRGKTF